MRRLVFALFIVIVSNFCVVTCSNTNFLVKQFGTCNNTKALFEFHGRFTIENGNNYMSNNITMTRSLDETIGVVCKIEYKLVNTFIELFTVREKYMCKAANIYGGEFWYDIQRAAQMIPGKCPIPAGRYHIHHHLIDFNKMALQTFPFGDLRFTAIFIENKNPQNILLCLVMEVDNIAN